MAKRSAAKELTHDNWNQQDEKEDPGSFTPLGEGALRNRIIKKAKRSLTPNSSGTSAFQGASPFAKFAGFTSTSSSPFGSMKNNRSDATSTFFAPSKNESETSSVNNSIKTETILNTAMEGSSRNSNTGNTIGSMNEAPKVDTRSIEYYRQLQSLNEGVLKWMQHHLEKNACCDFTPVFNDYKKHMDMLNVTYPINKQHLGGSDEVLKSTSASEDGRFASNTTSRSDIKANSAGSKANNGNSEDETDYGANFKSNTTNTSTFSFGIKSTPTATSSGSPMGPTSSSKEGAIEEKKSSSEFSFGFFSKANQPNTDKPFSFAVGPIEKSSESGNSTEDVEYVPPKNDFVAVAEEDALYSKRCKLFFKKGEVYADKGIGTLYLKSLEGKTQLVVRADTNLGNILLNIMLSASLPMSRTGKNNVLLVCIPNPPLEATKPDSKEAIPILIRVKTAEDADELLSALDKHKS